jgi:hydrogenase maturation protease
MAPVVDPDLTIFAWGNLSRADDGVGPMLASRIDMLKNPGIVLIEDMQLQIEHTTDIRADVPVLFIDASVAIEHGFVLQQLTPAPDPSISTHALSPTALLYLFESTMQQPAPPAFQLHIAGSNFELGEALSDKSCRAVDAAWRFLRRLFAQPGHSWQRTLEHASIDSLPAGC